MGVFSRWPYFRGTTVLFTCSFCFLGTLSITIMHHACTESILICRFAFNAGSTESIHGMCIITKIIVMIFNMSSV